MTPKQIAAAIGGLLVLSVIGFSYLGHVRADAEMNATLKQQGEVIAAALKKIEQADERIEQREAAWARREEDFASVLRLTKTPQQISVKMPEYAPNIGKPEIQQTPDGERVILTPEQYRVLFEIAVTKSKLEEKVVKLEADLADTRSKLEQRNVQIAALEKERDAAVKAAKGGGFWKRAGTWAKGIGLGIALGVALSR